MSLSTLRDSYLKKEIDKWEYIDSMYEMHTRLFEYSDFITDTNISRIEIQDKKVIMTFRDSEVKFICSKSDKRVAPIDALNFKVYEQDELKMQLNLIEPSFNVLDIGANYGWYALHIAKQSPNAAIFSFEPIPSTFKCLNENVALNNVSNIETLNFGLSDKEGKFNFFYDSSLSVNASLANVSGNSNIEEVVCNVKTLDEYWLEQKQIDFIKCDIEGAELFALKGGAKSIQKFKPIIFCEMLRKWTAKFNYHPNDIIAFLKEIGYCCFTLANEKLRPFEKVDEETIETNYFFLHKEKHQNQIQKYLAND